MELKLHMYFSKLFRKLFSIIIYVFQIMKYLAFPSSLCSGEDISEIIDVTILVVGNLQGILYLGRCNVCRLRQAIGQDGAPEAIHLATSARRHSTSHTSLT